MTGRLPANFDTEDFVKQYVARSKNGGKPGDTWTLSNGKRFHIYRPSKAANKQSRVQRSPPEGDTGNIISPLQATINRAKADVARENTQALVNRVVDTIKRKVPGDAEISIPEKKSKPPKRKPAQKKRLTRDIFS